MGRLEQYLGSQPFSSITESKSNKLALMEQTRPGNLPTLALKSRNQVARYLSRQVYLTWVTTAV